MVINPPVNAVIKNIDVEMSQNDFKIIQRFLSESCGIALSDNKQYLVKNRLARLLDVFGFVSFSELTAALQSSSFIHKKIAVAVVDAMTTNETFWFRDDQQFVELKEKIIPALFEKKAGGIKVWSAACSSGQEPYNISMCVEDLCMRLGKNRQVQITGTDISETILKEAKLASYSELALSRGIDIQTKNRFFKKTGESYQLNSQITQRVRFRQFNLLDSFSNLGRFDIIFCRNVLIYFSEEVKRDILTRMADSLEPDGYIFLSSTESMPMGIKELESVRKGRARYFKKRS